MVPRIRRCLLPLLMLFPLWCSAQTDMEDVVYLKNGSIIHGIIIEQVPNVSIKIQTADRNVFVFRIEEVEKIAKEAAPKSTGSGGKPGLAAEDLKQKGYSLIAQMNVGVGYNDFVDKSSVGGHVINGYQFSPNFFAGVGVGFDHHFSGAAFLPLFADLRVNFLKTTVTPFVDVAAGWTFGLAPEKDVGGVLANPSFGVKFFVSPKVALQFSVGYRYQEGTNTYETYTYYGAVNSRQYLHYDQNAVTLKFGVTL